MCTGYKHSTKLRKKDPEGLTKAMVLSRLNGEDNLPDVSRIHSTLCYQWFEKEANRLDVQINKFLVEDSYKALKAFAIREIYSFMNDHFGFKSATNANAAKNAVELIILERNWE